MKVNYFSFDRRAFYVSFTALIILFITLSFIISQQSVAQKRAQYEQQFSQNLLLINYIQDLEHSYFPSRIALAEKEALANITKLEEQNSWTFNQQQLETAVSTGKFRSSYTVVNRNDTVNKIQDYSYSVLNVPLKFTDFNFQINSISQVDDFHVAIKSTLHYKIEAGNVTWENTLPYTTVLSVTGLTYPKYSDYGPIVQGFWLVNATAVNQCYLHQVMSGNAAVLCNGYHDICPASDITSCS